MHNRIRRSLMPQQVKAFRWARNRSAAAFYMDMRLGKTLTAIRWARSRTDCSRILVVCPLTVIPAWQHELSLEGIDNAVLLTGTSAQRLRAAESNPDATWFILNWEGVAQRKQTRPTPTDVAALPWDCVILDESDRIRNPKAAVTKVALSVFDEVRYKALLSGLPNPEGPENFVTQMIFCFGHFMGHTDYWSWRAEYMQPTYSRSWVPKRGVAREINERVRRKAFVMSKADAGIGNKRIRETRYVTLPSKVLSALHSAEKHFEVGDRLTTNILEALTWQAQLTGGRFPHDDALHHDVKFVELLKLLKGELANECVVVWARYNAELAAVCAFLEKSRVSHVAAFGNDREAKKRAVATFQKGATQVLVAQPKGLDTGIDLSVASTAIYMSRYYSFALNRQSEERIEHPKKDHPLLFIDIVAADSTDESIAMALDEKTVDVAAFKNCLLRLLKKRA